jgi:dipeptidyl aminopeptidase/acylaminoacyl peptidase
MITTPNGPREKWVPKLQYPHGLLKAGWLEEGPALLMYDEHDIWQVDPAGNKPPINVTNGYGRRNNIIFRLAKRYRGNPIDGNDVILEAFDNKNKNSGFCKITIDRTSRAPEILAMGPYVYGPIVAAGRRRSFAKARDAEVYIVFRESAAAFPNLYWTEDFRIYKPITDVHPEKSYNWLTSELVHFPTLDRHIEQAVMYRPENFDPTKKYPVILHYYERKSDELNRFAGLENDNGGEISIPWFVSHGYIVFTPDIVYPSHRELGHNGQNALNAVVGAAKYLSRFAWVDTPHMGIQGHSFGGFETYYLVAHTNRFAAAVSSCGPSDEIASYNEETALGHGYFENRQGRTGATLWERPDLYFENSPILRADKVSTPILIMGNRNDGNVPFSQSFAWFTAMRRLGKRAWMLEYDDGGHGVGGKDYVDYTVRTTQFFDHYLKGAPPPMWMTRGIPARSKGIETGLALDTTGDEPHPLPSRPPAVAIH